MSNLQPNKVTILDTTLRDGSYVVNFSFTTLDVENICRELEQAGVTLIEIGHGVGLNGSNGFGQSAETDEDYMKAARRVLKTAKWGMFCIPGIARLDDLDVAGAQSMNFIRIGTNVDQVEDSQPFIKKAKQYGMFVAANYMKSYAASPEEFANNALKSEHYGADVVYIVDSAGGMFPDDIKRYFEAVRKVSSIPIGFHSHDNLGMAMANSLTAWDLGCAFIDGSLQGLGRSAGNAPTEMLVAALVKRGCQLDIDFLKLCAIGQKYVQPLIPTKGKILLDIVSGYADFHSSYMPHIRKAAVKHNVDPARLIVEYTKHDKININDDLLDTLARQIKEHDEVYLSKYDFSKYIGGEQDDRKS